MDLKHCIKDISDFQNSIKKFYWLLGKWKKPNDAKYLYLRTFL